MHSSLDQIWGVEPDVTHQTSAQVNVVCHKHKLVRLLFQGEPDVLLLFVH